MSPFEFLSLAKGWEAVIGGVVGMFAGWFGQWAKARLHHERNVIDATALENEQLRLALERERFLTDKLTECGEHYTLLWERFYKREEITKQYHSAALIARLRVNELELKAGTPMTEFAELDKFPPEDNQPNLTHKGCTLSSTHSSDN